jgi:transcription antitermination factor NusG
MHSAENGAEVQDPGVARHWHALYTRHQHEKSVTQALSNRGHEVFLPLVCAAHRWQDRTKQLWLPLFPCYVFIEGGFDRRVQILSTPGIISVVAWAGRPAIIPPAQIDAVRQMIESTLQVEPYPFLQSGDRVRVVAGPLRGIEGILVRKRNMFRLVVSMEMLGRSAAVEIDISCIEASSPSPAPVAIQSHRFSAFA